MYEVDLRHLKCLETEDWGSDECLLDVEVDGRQQPYLRRSMNDGDVWRLDRHFSFDDRVVVRLLEEDFPDFDDVLGEVVVEGSPTDGRTARLTGSGASYQLRYGVIQTPDRDPVQDALADFRRSSKPGTWRYVDKASLLADVQATVANPYAVNQDFTPLCGPAAIVFEFARTDPARYVAVCQELFEDGSFQARTERVEASATLRNSRPNRTTTPADWILMATLRDAENELFDVEGDSNAFVMGITTPGEMAGWAEEVLGFDTVSYESTYLYGEFDALRSARRAVDRGGVAFLMLHSDVLDGRRPAVDFPNHWVAFQGNLFVDEGSDPWWFDVDNGRVRFDCYSWGRTTTVDVGEGPFEDGMWGVVTAY